MFMFLRKRDTICSSFKKSPVFDTTGNHTGLIIATNVIRYDSQEP